MGRPALHDADDLLDWAVALAAAGGAGAVTMSAVARAGNAPSGSLYHRFPSRPALLAALWLRTAQRFQAGFLDAAARGAEAAAGHVVRWSRAEPVQARVLLLGADAFAPSAWPPEARAALAANERRLVRALNDLGGDPERVALAALDVPLAFVRRHLLAGRPLPADGEHLVADTARALLVS